MLPESLLPPLGQVLPFANNPLLRPEHPDWLGDPVPAHQWLHSYCPVAVIIGVLEQTLAQPVRLADYRGARYATVLGAYLFHLDDNDGTLLTWRWSAQGPIAVNEHEVALQQMVGQRDWLMQNADLLGTCLFDWIRRHTRLAPALMPVPPTTRAYARWLVDQIARTMLTSAAIGQTQQRLQQALGLNNALLAAAAHLPARSSARHGASVGDYNLMVASAEQINRIKTDSPALADLYPLYCDAPDFEQALEPAAALRQYLRRHGVDQATWRAVNAMGSAALEPLLALYEAPRDKAMLDLLNCLRALRLRLPSQLWALAHLFSTFGAHGKRPLQYLKSIDADAALTHLLACAPRTLSPNARQIDELDLVIRWAMDEHIGLPDKRQRQAGWQWLVRQAGQWQARERIRLKADRLWWETPVSALSIDRLTFVALPSELALWDEALVLHHCADVYGHRCRAGAYLLFSVRLPAAFAGSPTDRRMATLALSRLGARWTVDQLVGPANTGVNDAVENASLTLVKLLNQFSDAGSGKTGRKPHCPPNTSVSVK